jgi:hypothetical protein
MRKRLLQTFAVLVASASVVIAVPMGHVSAAGTTVGAVIPNSKCKELCYERFEEDMERCKRVRKPNQRVCREKAMDRYAKCLRFCDE